ncbi:N-acetylmuramoyl-L-alanine amidase [Geitlerinema splendidum]|nr:N-acetylmuramoyl-L-alanine amidase [Geitlerinema splendidum]
MVTCVAHQANTEGFTFVSPGKNNVIWVDSPHYGDRPEDAVIDTIVLHHTAGASLASTVKWFMMPESKVSAHYTIGKDGAIVQHVSTFKRAWHAGVSSDVRGKRNVNDYSVGIEIDNLGDGKDVYTEDQLNAVEHIVSFIMRRHPIRQIVSHEYIAEPPGRKVDPINFPWERMERFNVPLYYGQKKGG